MTWHFYHEMFRVCHYFYLIDICCRLYLFTVLVTIFYIEENTPIGMLSLFLRKSLVEIWIADVFRVCFQDIIFTCFIKKGWVDNIKEWTEIASSDNLLLLAQERGQNRWLTFTSCRGKKKMNTMLQLWPK